LNNLSVQKTAQSKKKNGKFSTSWGFVN